MLATPHFQVVFTLPAVLRPLSYANQKLVYDLLFRASSTVLRDLGAQRLGVRMGITSVLHTWTRELSYHPHVHVLVTAGGLDHGDSRWVSVDGGYLFPQHVLGSMFRGRVLEGLWRAFDAGELTLPPSLTREAVRTALVQAGRGRKTWVVHVEAPNGRPVAHVIKYLAQYVKRVALSDHRMVSVTPTGVSFRGREGIVTLDGAEFVRRFLLHVLPKGFRKVRHYGLYAPGGGGRRLEIARGLLSDVVPILEEVEVEAEGIEEAERLDKCPACGELAVRRSFPGMRFWVSREAVSPQPRGPPG
jgi:hypothetical protein